ncbi:hypothetical protein LSCM4_06033 [Leishmania orientalis]|uniref:Uncharacterized protein n=1 Tax=Leishmania orientalis TaxID=2249476 RepID=A0A836HW71_9TRYP|nr:hypothetical protein LSCM4_06033 [Leishmania orientalis]
MPTTPTSGRAAGTATATSSRHGVSESCPARREPSTYQLTTAAVLALQSEEEALLHGCRHRAYEGCRVSANSRQRNS